MKKYYVVGIGMVFIIAVAAGAVAGDMSHDMGHGAAADKTGHEMQAMTSAGGMEGMDQSRHGGELIHDGVVEGYRFAYHLTDIRERMAAMKVAGHAHEGMDATHHLMIYIEAPDGTPVGSAQVGFLVTGPDGEAQKLMCMEMGGGYGSDLKLGAGEYIIKTKAVAGDVKLMDEFGFETKD
jgi:hypothetical protein